MARPLFNNASIDYHVDRNAALTFIVDYLFDKQPYRDGTWTSYPSYSRSWFSPVGREVFAELIYHFGGKGG